MDSNNRLEFDFYVRSGLRAGGSRGGGDGPRPARIVEIRYDPSAQADERIARALDALVGRVRSATPEAPQGGADGR